MQPRMKIHPNNGSPPFEKHDYAGLAVLAALFALMMAASWQRWTQPLLDHGREMHLPSRLAAGETLYADVQFLYGPLAPYLNALLYRVFGVHLSVLHTAGTIAAVLILFLIYRLARRLMGVWESALATGLVLMICALKSTANYVQPYAYAALYGLLFALVSLLMTAKYMEAVLGERGGHAGLPLRYLLGAGIFAGLSVISKPEIALAALAAAGAALLMQGLKARKILWREGGSFGLPALLIVAATYGWILRTVPLRTLLDDNHILFSNMPPQLIYFNQHISGLANWPGSLWFTLAGFGVFALWAGICVVIGAALSRKQPDWKHAMRNGAILLLAGAIFRETAIKLLHVPSDVTPFAAAPIFLPIFAICLLRLARSPALSLSRSLFLVFTTFSFVSILRAILNVTTTGPYTPFFIPLLIVVTLFLLFETIPAWLSQDETLRAHIRRVAMGLIAILIAGMGVNSAKRFSRGNDFEVATERGSFRTSREIGEPLAAAIQYVQSHSRPEDYVLSLPVATTINFMAARPYPLREEIVHPGFLAGPKEDEAIAHLESLRVPLVVIANLDTSEFRDRSFGLDYNVKLMEWIRQRYRVAVRFDSPGGSSANFGRVPFFITVYARNP